MIKIYGSPKSSARRCYWTLEEAGVPYEHVHLDWEQKEHKGEAYLQLNPNGKIPCLVDGDFVLWESMAIDIYIAEKYKPELLGSTIEERALVNQWGCWSFLELAHPIMQLFYNKRHAAEGKGDPAIEQQAKEKLGPICTVLDNHLSGKDFMVGDKITLADIHVATVIFLSSFVDYDISAYTNITRWLEAMCARPSFKKISA